MADSVLAGPDTMNAPWGLHSRLKLVELACEFFDLSRNAENHAVIDRKPAPGQMSPFGMLDFLEYLKRKKAFSGTPDAFRVARILERMVSAGLLLHILEPNAASIAGLLQGRYALIETQPARRRPFSLVPVLGPEYLYRLCAPSLVHISGTNDGVAVAGTGLVVDARHVLTCRHVVSDMDLDPVQTFQDREYAITAESIHRHPEIDVAMIRVDGAPLSPVPGILLQAPVVAQAVFTLGYPKLPGLRDASVTMQQGTVTNESVTSLAGENLFLYSAIARPGNSGGPVMSDDGYVVGLSIVDACGQYVDEDAFSPHYAGIPGQLLVKAVDDLSLGIQLPFENYE